jgi:hypothetical protein
VKYANPFIHNIIPCIMECKKSPGIINNLCDVAGCVTIEMGTQKVAHSAQQGCFTLSSFKE